MQRLTTYCSPVANRYSFSLAFAAVAFAASPALADDGYCDYVEGTASAESATLFAPEVFAQIGYIELNSVSMSGSPDVESDGTRFVGGVRWRLSGLMEGSATKARASADCSRHKAFEQVRGDTIRAALEARGKVYEAAMPEAEKILAATNADFEARRATAQEAMATRLRVEDLRRAAGDNASQLRALPASSGTSLAGAVAAYHAADADMEDAEARVRRWKAIDVSVRAGVDEYLSIDTGDRSPFFGVLSVGVNLGVLFQGSGNSRAAAGRKRLLASGRDSLSQEGTVALAQAAQKRAADTATLEADLKRQIDALDRVGGDDSRRYRLIVWFDWIKAGAEHAYYQALAQALNQVVAR
jgi:hypothetical protein